MFNLIVVNLSTTYTSTHDDACLSTVRFLLGFLLGMLVYALFIKN